MKDKGSLHVKQRCAEYATVIELTTGSEPERTREHAPVRALRCRCRRTPEASGCPPVRRLAAAMENRTASHCVRRRPGCLSLARRTPLQAAPAQLVQAPCMGRDYTHTPQLISAALGAILAVAMAVAVAVAVVVVTVAAINMEIETHSTNFLANQINESTNCSESPTRIYVKPALMG